MAQRKDEPASAEGPPGVTDAADTDNKTAAALLVREMEACERAMRNSLALWEAKKEDKYSDHAEFFLDKAVSLADATARLAQALAGMKSEARQHIRVERVAGTLDSAAATRNAAGQSPREALQTRKRALRAAQGEGEGGDA